MNDDDLIRKVIDPGYAVDVRTCSTCKPIREEIADCKQQQEHSTVLGDFQRYGTRRRELQRELDDHLAFVRRFTPTLEEPRCGTRVSPHGDPTWKRGAR